jgi:hypothetical protein
MKNDDANEFMIPKEEWDAVCAEIKSKNPDFDENDLQCKMIAAQAWCVREIKKLRTHKHAPPLELMRFR